MIINKSILHILDLTSDVTVLSDELLDISNVSIDEFITKHILKIFSDNSANPGIFKSNSEFKNKLDEFKLGNLEFIELSLDIAKKIEYLVSNSERMKSVDILISEFLIEEKKYIGIFMYENQIGYTHQIINNNGKVKAQIINHYSILPNPNQKVSSYAMVNLENYNIKSYEKSDYICEKDMRILKDGVLECENEVSQKDTMNIIKKVVERVAVNNDIDSVKAVADVKNYIIDNAENEFLEPVELCKDIFEHSEKMQTQFLEEVTKVGLSEKVEIDREYAYKTSKIHKIKTDTGIEISIPSQQLQNRDIVEFVNNPDGTISIQINIINKILNK